MNYLHMVSQRCKDGEYVSVRLDLFFSIKFPGGVRHNLLRDCGTVAQWTAVFYFSTFCPIFVRVSVYDLLGVWRAVRRSTKVYFMGL